MSKGTAFTPSAYRRSPVRRTAPCCRRPERSRPGSPRTGLRPWGGQTERLNFSRSCSSHEERGRACPTRASATLLRRVRASSLSLDAPGKAYAASHSSHLARCTSMAARASSTRRARTNPDPIPATPGRQFPQTRYNRNRDQKRPGCRAFSICLGDLFPRTRKPSETNHQP